MSGYHLYRNLTVFLLFCLSWVVEAASPAPGAYGRSQNAVFAQAIAEDGQLNDQDRAFFNEVVPNKFQNTSYILVGSGLGFGHLAPIKIKASLFPPAFRSVTQKMKMPQVAVGYLWRHWALETRFIRTHLRYHQDAVYVRDDGTHLAAQLASSALTVDLLYLMKEWQSDHWFSWRPYVSAGLGYGHSRVHAVVNPGNYTYLSLTNTTVGGLVGGLGAGLRSRIWGSILVDIGLNLHLWPSQPDILVNGISGAYYLSDKRYYTGSLGGRIGWTF